MRRSAKYIGSKVWRERDVSFVTNSGVATFVQDKPSGISIRYGVPVPLATGLHQLAHRVRQLTT